MCIDHRLVQKATGADLPHRPFLFQHAIPVRLRTGDQKKKNNYIRPFELTRGPKIPSRASWQQLHDHSRWLRQQEQNLGEKPS